MKPLFIHHLTLNPICWFISVAILVAISSFVAFFLHKQTALFWKMVDLVWIIFALSGAAVIVTTNNKFITEQFLEVEKNSLKYQVESFEMSYFEPQIYCKNKNRNIKICDSLQKAINATKDSLSKNVRVELKEHIFSDINQDSLSKKDKSIIEEIKVKMKNSINSYNEILAIKNEWQALRDSAAFDFPLLSYLGSILFVFAFALRFGKSIFDIKIEALKTIALEKEKKVTVMEEKVDIARIPFPKKEYNFVISNIPKREEIVNISYDGVSIYP